MTRPFGTMSPIEPNPVGNKFAEWLYKIRDAGGFMGDLFIGEAPEVIEDMSYGFPPYSGSGQTTQLDPRLVDVAGLPLPYAGAYYGAKGLAKGAKKLDDVLGKITPTPDEYGMKSVDDVVGELRMTDRHPSVSDTPKFAGHVPVDESRRQFLKNMGLATAGAAAATSVPHFAGSIMKGLGNDAARVGATTAAKVISNPGGLASALSYFRVFPHMLDELRKGGWEGAKENIWRYNGPGQDLTPDFEIPDDIDPEDVIKAFEKNRGKDVLYDDSYLNKLHDEVFDPESPGLTLSETGKIRAWDDLDDVMSQEEILTSYRDGLIDALYSGVEPKKALQGLMEDYASTGSKIHPKTKQVIKELMDDPDLLRFIMDEKMSDEIYSTNPINFNR